MFFWPWTYAYPILLEKTQNHQYLHYILYNGNTEPCNRICNCSHLKSVFTPVVSGIQWHMIFIFVFEKSMNKSIFFVSHSGCQCIWNLELYSNRNPGIPIRSKSNNMVFCWWVKYADSGEEHFVAHVWIWQWHDCDKDLHTTVCTYNTKLST